MKRTRIVVELIREGFFGFPKSQGIITKKHVKADWQFTTADARVKLKRL
jgi:hypothetical protein